MNFREGLKNIVENTDTRSGKTFDLVIQFFIVFSLITFSISTIPDLSKSALELLFYLQVLTVTVFSVEYVLRIFVADKKSKYIFSFYGVIDLLAILPFYLSLAIDLRSLRIVRLIRIFRIFKITRYSKAIRRYKLAFTEIREELVLFGVATLFMIYMSAVGIYYFESAAQPEAFKSIFHSLWWSIATLTTVGYGDVYPITMGGRVFTFFILMIGLSIVAIPAGLLASALKNAGEVKS